MSQNTPANAPAIQPLKLEIHDNLAILTFDQPGSRANTLGHAVVAEFERVVGELERHKEVQGLIFRSAKPGMFIAGADLRELGQAENDPKRARYFVERGLQVFA